MCSCPMPVPLRSRSDASTPWHCSACGRDIRGPDPSDAEIARLKAEVERVTEVARLLVGECEEQRECPVCGTDTSVEVCRPSCYVAKMRKVLDDKKGGG